MTLAEPGLVAQRQPDAVHLPAAARQPRGLHVLLAWPAPVHAGCLALLAAAAMAFWLAPRWQADAVQARAERQHRVAALARSRAAPPPPSAPQDAQRLLQALPDADAAPPRIAALLALAARHGLAVDSARQVAAPAAVANGLPVAAAALTLLVRGSAAGMRQFVADALQHDDALVLAQWRMQRNQASARELTADLQWQLLQRSAPAQGSR